MHRSYGLQGSLKRRYKHPSLLPSMGTTRQKSSCRNGLQNGPRLLSRVKAGTHSPSPTGSHTAAYTPKQGPSGQGRYHYPRRIPHVHEHPRAGCQNGKLCRFWVLAGGALPKNAESLGTAMRLSISLPSHIWAKDSQRKRMHAYGVHPLPPAPQPRWAAKIIVCLSKSFQ